LTAVSCGVNLVATFLFSHNFKLGRIRS